MWRVGVIAVAALALWPAGADASCAGAGVIYRHVGYEAVNAGPELPHLNGRFPGVVPACNDTPPLVHPDTPVTLARIGRIDPRIAVARPATPGIAYVAQGFFVRLPEHPLHDALYGSPSKPNGARHCDGRLAMRGTVAYTPGLAIGFRLRGRRMGLTTDALTRIEGFRRLGLAYIRGGDRIVVRGLVCGEFLLARDIEPF